MNEEKKIKIAFVINYIAKNGPSCVVLNIISNLDLSKYEVMLITLFSQNDSSIVEELRSMRVHVYICTSLSRIKCILSKNNEFQSILKNEKFDIIHTHGFIPDILLAKSKIKAKKISTIHNNMFEDYMQQFGKVKSKIFILMHLHALKKFSICIGCSEFVYSVMQNYLLNMTYIRNGIKPLSERSNITREEIGIPQKSIIFVYAGGVTLGKNVRFLVDNFVKYHDDREYLLVLGDGADIEYCKERADSHVRFLGFQKNPISYFIISDIYVSASKSEGCSISVLEALSCGMTLFLSDIPSHKEIVTMSERIYLGELFTLKDEGQEFGSRLQKIRNNYESVSKEEIRLFQQEILSDKVMASMYEEIYKSM